ncbi:hypothetical protein ACTJKO_06275 [Curtobacterium sp. 22159]|uniref:hypothetical protein n=1 Tax=Curtobacterium sp. 22159 TaxID=3453882 RepID=UPI003F83A917
MSRGGLHHVELRTADLDAAERSRLSHLAFHAGGPGDVARIWDAAPGNGWRRLYEDRHPYAGGPEHHAAFLEDGERFKVELVAG